MILSNNYEDVNDIYNSIDILIRLSHLAYKLFNENNNPSRLYILNIMSTTYISINCKDPNHEFYKTILHEQMERIIQINDYNFQGLETYCVTCLCDILDHLIPKKQGDAENE